MPGQLLVASRCCRNADSLLLDIARALLAAALSSRRLGAITLPDHPLILLYELLVSLESEHTFLVDVA